MKEIQLTKGYVAIVDDDDFERVSKFNWYAKVHRKTVYAKSRGASGTGKLIALHQFILGAKFIDHKNGDGLDNRRENLRQCTHAQNTCGIKRGSKTGFVGVRKNGPGFCTMVARKYVGQFATAEEAARAYDAKAREVYGEFARLNFA